MFQNSEVAGSICLNLHIGGTIHTQHEKYDVLKDPDEVMHKLLGKIIRFWKRNRDAMETKFKGFKKSEEERIKKEIGEFSDVIKHFKTKRPELLGNDILK